MKCIVLITEKNKDNKRNVWSARCGLLQVRFITLKPAIDDMCNEKAEGLVAQLSVG